MFDEDIADSRIISDCSSTGDVTGGAGASVGALIGEDVMSNITLNSISITTPAAKLNFMVREALDINGLVVTAAYCYNNTAKLPITTAHITGFNSGAPVTGQKLTITFGGESTTYTVDITPLVWEGGGSAGNPYRVSSAAHLNAVRDFLNDPSIHFLQTGNINLSGYSNWTPIGDSANQFAGTYDGGGYTISNLTINSSALIRAGLFGLVGNGGRLKNIILQNVDISSSGHSLQDSGGLVGYNNGSVTACGVSGSVTHSAPGSPYIGGLAGQNNGTITASFSDANVTGNASSTGGLVGFNGRTIMNCYSIGGVSGGSNSGGLVGYDWDGTITNCYSTGAVTGTNVGGLIGNRGPSATANNSYYLDTAAVASAGGAPLTETELKQKESFDGWDFDGIWHIWEDTAYPALRWQLPSITYHANRGKGSAPVEMKKMPGEPLTIAANMFTVPSGKQFKHWNTQADGAGTSYAEGDTMDMPASPLDLYAIWESSPGGGGGGTPTYRQRTLANNATGVTASGNSIHSGAQLTIKTIDARSLPAQIREAIAQGELIAGYDITLSGGFMGELALSFPVGEEYNGWLITILHYVNGRVETYTAVVTDGRATVTVSSLSPFVVLNTGMIVPDITVTDPPKTGDTAMPLGFVMLGLTALCAL